MIYPVKTAIQLRGILRGLRQSRNLTQAQLGELMGISQKRVARIENAPGVTSFDQIARLVTVLGGQIIIAPPGELSLPDNGTLKKGPGRKVRSQETW
jgi:HTH-type transcriptional regulator/antitoxin HipB